MANIILGKVAITWKGEFLPSVHYRKQDVVYHNGSAYICVVESSDNSSETAFDSSEWDLFAQGTQNIATTEGDILYHDGIKLERLPIGEHNQILHVNSEGLPEWTSNPSRSSVRARAFVPFRNVGFHAHNALVIMDDNSLRTWGYGSHYLLGQGDHSGDRANPVLFPFPDTFPGVKEDHVWQGHSYNGKLIDKNDELWTWGRLGQGSTGIGADAFTPINVMSVEDGANPFRRSAGGLKAKFIAHTAGTEAYNTSGIIASDNKVYMCGRNESGQLGRGNTEDSSWYIQVPYFNTLVEGQPAITDPDTGEVTVEAVDPRTVDWLSLGRERYTHCVAVDDSLRAHIWGENSHYELGNNSTVDSTLPFIANNGTLSGKNIKKAWANFRTTWFLCSDDTLHVCGTDYYGNTGVNGNTGSSGVNTNSRVPALSATDVQEIAMVYYSSYQSTWILKTDGTLYATGYNGYGQLGSNGTSAQATWAPIDMGFLQPGESVLKMVSGGDGSYSSFGVVTDQGRVYTCGYNGQGQLGHGDASHKSTLTPVICRDYITDACFFGNGSNVSFMVLLEDGQVLVCGAGENAQLASEDSEDYWVLNPVRF